MKVFLQQNDPCWDSFEFETEIKRLGELSLGMEYSIACLYQYYP